MQRISEHREARIGGRRSTLRRNVSGIAYILSLLACTLPLSAQTTVTTSGGSSGTLPKFDGSASIVPSVITEQGGHLGIGVANPAEALDVNGNLLLSTPGAAIKFSDGSSQMTAWPGMQAFGFGIANPVIIQSPAGSSASTNVTSSGAAINKTFLMISSDPHNYKIATLPPSNLGSHDHLHLVATLNRDWSGPHNLAIDGTFSNSGVFAFVYTQKRSAPDTNGNGHVTAYRQSDGSVDIYLSFSGQYWWTSGSYSILENMAAQVYSDPPDAGGTVSGTLVFDSANTAAYPPVMFSSFSGDTGLGTVNPGAKLEVNGNLKFTAGSGASITFADGTSQSTAWNGTLCGGDYAESVDVTGAKVTYEPGDVLVLDPANPDHFIKSTTPYSKMVAGVYSTKPGVVGRHQTTPKNKEELPMAMIGIVPVKVSTENGPIHIGDLLVTSSTPGVAMKGTDRGKMLGAVIGKSMDSISSRGGIIKVLLNVQ